MLPIFLTSVLCFLSMLGFTRAETLGRNCRFLQGADTDTNTVKEIGQVLLDVYCRCTGRD